ncbi:unnamed protein product [Calypogeia fissa]
MWRTYYGSSANLWGTQGESKEIRLHSVGLDDILKSDDSRRLDNIRSKQFTLWFSGCNSSLLYRVNSEVLYEISVDQEIE